MSSKMPKLIALVWSHPIISCCILLLLLLTPPVFHIIVYFSPLLISTALFVVALVSMKPQLEETIQEHSSGILMASESVAETQYEEHSQCKSFCGKSVGSKDDLWVHWVKMADGRGITRSWVETHLKVESSIGFCDLTSTVSSFSTTAAAIELIQAQDQEHEDHLQVSNERFMAAAAKDLPPTNSILGISNQTDLETISEELPTKDSKPSADHAENNPDLAVKLDQKALILPQGQISPTPQEQSLIHEALNSENDNFTDSNAASINPHTKSVDDHDLLIPNSVDL